jgi:hypothetical protein
MEAVVQVVRAVQVAQEGREEICLGTNLPGIMGQEDMAAKTNLVSELKSIPTSLTDNAHRAGRTLCLPTWWRNDATWYTFTISRLIRDALVNRA